MIDDENITPEEQHTAEVQGLFIQYLPVVRSYILSMLPNFSLADDVAQETFLVVSRKATDFDLETSFPAWVKTIARLKTLEAIRRERGRHVFLSEEVLDALSLGEEGEFPQASEVENKIELLNACIEDLAPQAKRSIEYRYRRDLPPPQIAEMMECSVQSVHVTLSRARVFLRECIRRKSQVLNP
jgi:RNA polymerase sigma-70 factor (ECF subfamily)